MSIYSPSIRLIAFDLDGTLMHVSDNRISSQVRKAIQATQARGVTITLATGRPFAFTRPVAQALALEAPLICYQGGVVQALDGQILRQIVFTGDTIAPAIALAQRRDWQFYLERDSRLILEAGRHYDDLLFDIHPMDSERMAELATPEQRASQLGVFFPDGVRQDDVDALAAALGPTATVMRTHHYFVNAIPAGVSKGTALAWLANSLSIPREAVMAVGDSDNDTSMVTWAGVGVAMGNARPAVLAAADWIAPPLEDHGAAAALERYILTDNREG